MNKLTQTFIDNANKSNQKPVQLYSAYTGKRVKPGDELVLTFYGILCYGAAAVITIGCVIGFIYHVSARGVM